MRNHLLLIWMIIMNVLALERAMCSCPAFAHEHAKAQGFNLGYG